MRLTVLLLALLATSCGPTPPRPIAPVIGFSGEPTGADTGSER